MPDIASIAVPVAAAAKQAVSPAVPTGGGAQVPEAPPAGPTPPRAAPPPRTPEALQQQLDNALAEADTSLRFRVDPEAGRVVVSVLDHRGDVLMQIPDEAALAVARHLAATGTLVDARA